MQSWPIHSLSLQAHRPQILTSTPDARAIALALPAGESLQEHEVHERAWVIVIEGEVEVLTPTGEATGLERGTLFAFEPNERHEVRARQDARLLLLLTPWPGTGHPGAMSLEDKAEARARAREHAGPDPASQQ